MYNNKFNKFNKKVIHVQSKYKKIINLKNPVNKDRYYNMLISN